MVTRLRRPWGERMVATASPGLADLRRDIRRYSPTAQSLWVGLLHGLYSHPSLAGVMYYRLGRALLAANSRPGVRIMLLLYQALYPLVRLYSGVELSPRAKIGPGLCIMHFGPTIIHPDVEAGEELTLLHGVTIGADRSGTPRLGDGVSVGAGATIIGKLTIGDGARIGAGAVVTAPVPAHCTAVGVPARVLGAGLPQSPADNR